MKTIGLITAVLFFIFTTACNLDNTNGSTNQLNDSINSAVINSENKSLTDSSTNAKMDENTENPQLSEEYTAKYICPNHDKGSGSDKPGDCPVCGMELIENPNYQTK